MKINWMWTIGLTIGLILLLNSGILGKLVTNEDADNYLEGYWELDYAIPKNGHHYACFAKLYQRTEAEGGRAVGGWGTLEMNIRWINDNVVGVTTTTTAEKWNGPSEGWLTDLRVVEYRNPRFDAAKTMPIDQRFFPDSDYDWVWVDRWQGEPYQYGYAFSGGHFYYPGGPEGRYGLMIDGKYVKFLKKYELIETADGVRVRIYVAGPPPGPIIEDYFHEKSWRPLGSVFRFMVGD